MPASNESIQLEFLPNPGGEDEGLGHAGIETYRRDPFPGAAREIGQNSRDASMDLPVRIAFDYLELPSGDMPGLESLEAAIKKCLAQVVGKEKEEAFFAQALRAVSGKVIRVLRISDTNTTGARGPSEKGTAFYSLLKGSGVSIKDNVDSGGSFGIGKNAVFAISDAQAVFYSTLYKNEAGEEKYLAQGKVILVSHTDDAGEPRRQTGYWGSPGFNPVSDQRQVPDWLKRSEIGTSIYVLGFREAPDWQQRLEYSLVQNFFPAVHTGEMEFSLDKGKHLISKLNLQSQFASESLVNFAKTNDKESQFELVKNLYRCLSSAEAKEKVIDVPSIGRVEIRVLVAERMPKKVFIVRNGMVITDSLEHFGDKFVRFNMYQEFVAVVTPLDKDGSAFIKKLEDPKHQELSAEGLPDEEKRAHARRVMKKLAQEIRNVIKEHTLTQFESEQSLDEMRNYFSAPSNPDNTKVESEHEDPETLRYKPPPRKPRRQFNAASSGEGKAGAGVTGSDTGPGPAPGNDSRVKNPDAPPSPNGSGGNEQLRPIPIRDVRNTLSSVAGARTRAIYFTSTEDGTAVLSLKATGLNLNEELPVLNAVNSALHDGRVRVDVKANVRTHIEVEFVDDYRGPIDVHMSLVSSNAQESAS